MNIPRSNRKRALIVVDVQESFLDERNRYVVRNILDLLRTEQYDTYVVATFHAEAGSLWEKQQGWTCPRGPSTETVPEIAEVLQTHDPIVVEKETRSVFKGNVDLARLLHERNTKEVHVVGTQTNDCVLATVFDAFDLGFLAYAIEECCEAESLELHETALALLRAQNMTNNSVMD